MPGWVFNTHGIRTPFPALASPRFRLFFHQDVKERTLLGPNRGTPPHSNSMALHIKSFWAQDLEAGSRCYRNKLGKHANWCAKPQLHYTKGHCQTKCPARRLARNPAAVKFAILLDERPERPVERRDDRASPYE